MNEIIAVNKPLGMTSYDVIRGLKQKYPKQKIGHAGTLDPLASGILICLVGSEATKRQSEFMNISKDYEFDILFGVGTDTFDILGLITSKKNYDPQIVQNDIETHLQEFKGKSMQKVPPFSAVKIDGRELYRWYLDGRINEIVIPEKEIEVEEIQLISSRIVSRVELHNEIIELVNKVKAGFRQKIVLQEWEKFFEENSQENFLVSKAKATVSKGTYVRAIANDLGSKIGIPACTITITRTRVGEFSL